MLFSILICTIESRKDRFALLFNYLKSINKYTDVEILFECDNKKISVGAKRQKLLTRAKGKFIAFIDDDDWVPEYYIDEVRSAILNNVNIDCIGFKIHCTGTKYSDANCSNKYKEWAENVDGFGYVRTIYHKSPIRREIALKAGFKDMRFAEDHDYSVSLKKTGLLKTEHYINKVMYIYRYAFENPKTKYGIK